MDDNEYYKYIKSKGYRGYNPKGMLTKTLMKFLRANLHIKPPKGYYYNPSTGRFIYETKSNAKKVKQIKRETKTSRFFVSYHFAFLKRFRKTDSSPWSKWYDYEETMYQVFTCTKAEIDSRVEYEVLDWIAFQNALYIHDKKMEFDSPRIISVTIVKRSSINKKVDIKGEPMKNATTLKYNFMPAIDDFTFKTTNNQCVYQLFEKRYGEIKHRAKTAEHLYKYVNEYHMEQTGEALDRSVGVTPNQLAYACEKMDIAFMCFDITNNLVIKQKSRCNHLPALVIYSVDNHMYMITDKKLLDSIRKQHADTKHTSAYFAEEKEHELKGIPNYDYDDVRDDLDTIDLKDGKAVVIVDGHDLWNFFIKIVKRTNQIPKVQHRGERSIKCVIYERPDGGKVFVQVDPNHGESYNWKDVKAFCTLIGVPFTNQGIGSLVDSYYQVFRKQERMILVGKAREEFLTKHGNKCSCCPSTEKLEIDHIKPLANGGTNDESNLQVLCKKCHFVKCQDEKEDGYIDIDPIVSSFNSNVAEVFDGGFMDKWAFCERLAEGNGKYGYDINRCRKNLLYYSKYQFPVFSVMDKIEPFDGAPVRCGCYYVETKNYRPLRGNGFYYEPEVDYCLEQGIIKKEDIKYQIIPSTTLAPDHFQPFIDDVYKKFGDMGKLAINAFIGCFYRRQAKNIKSVYTRSIKEACYAFTKYDAKFASYLDGVNLYQVLHEQTIKFEENRSPLYLQILGMEAVELHKLEQLVGGVTFVKTDAVYSTNKVDISSYEWAPGVPKYKTEKPGRTDYEKCKGFMNTCKFEYEPLKWNVIEDSDDFEGLIKQIQELGCVNIDGRAGAGKTTLVKMLKAKLDENERLALAPTNKAARIINGATIHKKFGIDGKHINLKNLQEVKYIFVDEISMCVEQMYKMFITIKRMRPDMRFIIVGDYLQLAPVKDRVGKKTMQYYKGSGALHELCDGNRIQLTKWRRADGEDPMTKGRDYFGKKECRLSLCFTNKTRKAINKKWMEKEAPADSIVVRQFCYDGNSQDMKVYEGLPVIARKNDKEYGIANNDTFTVYYISEKDVTFERDDGSHVVVPLDKFKFIFYPAYAITIHKSQGSTFDTEYSIYEWEKLDARLKYVALTRASNISLINIT